MKSIDRVKAAVNFQGHDRPPVMPQIFGHSAIISDISLHDYSRDGELMARAQINAMNRYGTDVLFAVMGTSIETETLGSTLTYRSGMYPYVENYALSDPEMLDTLRIPDPETDGRMPQVLKAISIMRHETAGETLITGFILGPMTLAMQLLEPTKGLYLAIDKPDMFSRILDFATDVSTAFGLAQLKAGADLALVFDPCSSQDFIPPQFFREIELPRLKRLFTALKQGGAIANWIHTAGPTASIQSYYPEAGADIANMDYCVDPMTTIKNLPRTCIDGSIRPMAFIEDSPDEITRESEKLLSIFEKRGGFILASGCEVPPESKPGNIEALVNAAKRRG